MKFVNRLTALAVLTLATTAAFADSGGGALDMSSGSTIFGRNNAQGIFTDTWTFTLASAGTLITGTASSAAVGDRDLDFSSIQLFQGATLLASFAGNLGTDAHEFYTLSPVNLNAGNYSVVVKGINSLNEAAYAGTLAIMVTAAVPEPETYALMLACLGMLGFVGRRRRLK